MDPHLLATFLAVRKHRNFTRAAEELAISQPAVSRQIQQLERQLGVPVFDRLGRGLHLTDAGETLAEQAQKVLLELESVAEAVRRHASPGTGSLRIGAGTTPGLYLLPGILGAFRRKHPRVEIAYAIERSANVIEQVRRNEVDLGFVGCEVEDRALVSEPVFDDEIVCFASPRHALAHSRRRLDLTALCDETWIVRPPGSATRAMFDSWVSGMGRALGRTIEIGCPEGIRALVMASVGIASMSVHAIAADRRRRRVVTLNVRGLPLRRSIWAIRHADKRVSPPAQAFMELVRGRG
jgi:DNA-binding transcriptional LysR family regulator